VYSMLQDKGKDDGRVNSPRGGGKETNNEEDGLKRRFEDRSRARSFGTGETVKWTWLE
jgi:hypothetical protein